MTVCGVCILCLHVCVCVCVSVCVYVYMCMFVCASVIRVHLSIYSTLPLFPSVFFSLQFPFSFTSFYVLTHIFPLFSGRYLYGFHLRKVLFYSFFICNHHLFRRYVRTVTITETHFVTIQQITFEINSIFFFLFFFFFSCHLFYLFYFHFLIFFIFSFFHFFIFIF